ncbi:hypothetical protein C2S53_010358 [Perilla frutescens var. hirtella]|uniref:Dirigent protein n=1 Tax=Perilla frutescens var. hirtella TaxID=608512 RepID=A0AAD4P2Q8_PERFH|nr:hypothetical protein C2S53_010358 [Perilla frutescens var. hirtella]
MKKLVIAATLILWSSILGKVSPSLESPKAVEKWVETLIHKQEKLTKLHFYFHRLAGAAPSGVVIAAAADMTNRPNPTGFGETVIKDDPLTLRPELSSTRIGYVQGMATSASLNDVVLVDYFTLSFIDPTHNGSTLAVLGSNPILHKYREMPVVGGTGVFRLARGVVTYQTNSFNATSGEACIEVDAIIFHF